MVHKARECLGIKEESACTKGQRKERKMCVMKSGRRGNNICEITRCDLDCRFTCVLNQIVYLCTEPDWLRTRVLGLPLENGMDNENGLWTVK